MEKRENKDFDLLNIIINQIARSTKPSGIVIQRAENEEILNEILKEIDHEKEKATK